MDQTTRKNNEIKWAINGLAAWMRNNVEDEWFSILCETEVNVEARESGIGRCVGIFSRLNDEYQYEPPTNILGSVSVERLEELVRIQDFSVGNADWPEIVRVNHLTPLRYFINLQEVSICHNCIISLGPLWALPGLKRIWIEGTNIPMSEIEQFRIDHPQCRVELQSFL